MNYKTLIAFLGKNQMKDWATPRSEWIDCLKSSGEWSEEFMKIKNLKSSQERCSFQYYAVVEYTGKKLYFHNTSGCSPNSYTYRYCIDKDFTLIDTVGQNYFEEAKEWVDAQSTEEIVEHCNQEKRVDVTTGEIGS
jgi:hypothetical protein